MGVVGVLLHPQDGCGGYCWVWRREDLRQKGPDGKTGKERMLMIRNQDTVTLTNKDLIDVKQHLTALYDLTFDGKILSNVLRLAHLVMH